MLYLYVHSCKMEMDAAAGGGRNCKESDSYLSCPAYSLRRWTKRRTGEGGMGGGGGGCDVVQAAVRCYDLHLSLHLSLPACQRPCLPTAVRIRLPADWLLIRG